MIERFKRTARGLPDKKRYIELITALLSVPVLITVLIANVSSLKGEESKKPEPTIVERVTVIPQNDGKLTRANPDEEMKQDACKKEVGPVSISYPEENETVTDNPVLFDINYAPDETYCAVVWSYRVNGNKWSGYDDSSIGLYDLPQGDVTFDLRVKSIVSGAVKTLTRHFVYNGTPINPTLSEPTPSTPSAR